MADSAKTYVLHVWDQDSSNKEAPNLVSVLMQTLSSNGWEHSASSTDQTNNPEMVILVSLHRDIQTLPLKDAQVFLGALPKEGKVLFVSLGYPDAAAHGCTHASNQASLCDWFFHLPILDAEDQWADFSNWLKDEKAVCASRNIGIDVVLDGVKQYSKALYSAVEEHINQGAFLLEKLCALYEITGTYGYDRVEHDIHSRICQYKNDPGSAEDRHENIGKAVIKKSTADDMTALWDGLRYAHLLKAETNKKILLIDDKATFYADKVKNALSVFGLDIQVDSIDTSRNDNKEVTKKLANYRSFQKLTNMDQQLSVCILSNDGSSDKQDISYIFGEYQVILVDLLMPGPNSREELIGIDIIRGLRRLAIDHASDNKRYNIPDIIAFSMADDVNKVQSAMRYGAAGYIFKPRTLALAGLLGRLGKNPNTPAIHNRRNFRQLYELPDTTVRLLKRMTIPRLRFDRATDKLSDPEKQSRADMFPLAQRMAKLLQRIPKTDLHVHVGSCMSPEFLVVASAVMLLRHENFADILSSYNTFSSFWSGKKKYTFIDELNLAKNICNEFGKYSNDEHGIDCIATKVRGFLLKQIEIYSKSTDQEKFRIFRSILHQSLGIPGHWDNERVIRAIGLKPNIDLFLFLMTQGKPDGQDSLPVIRGKDDIIRFFLLFQAANGGYNKPELCFEGNSLRDCKLLDIFKCGGSTESTSSYREVAKIWEQCRELFYGDLLRQLKNNCWRLSRDGNNQVYCKVSLGRQHDELLCELPAFEEDPISWLLATGTRCNNLLEYLEGCEFSGAEHLRHPWLIHLYAQQASWQFAQQGLMYVELRAAVSGYENSKLGFDFQSACSCMVAAFKNSTQALKARYYSPEKNDYKDWLWNEDGCFGISAIDPCFPQKVGLTLTGKRHKPIRALLREASAAIIFRSDAGESLMSARNFVHAELTRCRFVGFDLAGPEEDFPPELFATEFSQISRMHIPITVHSGENAPPRFVENAVVDLGAKRVGHGLSTAEDRTLMNRLREDRICIELCPSSNFQTNQLVPYKESPGREYPLITYLKNGNAICINTDNPIISYTNIIKEYLMAAWSCGEGERLTLWDLLRIIRMGFIHSFMSVPDRRAVIQLADQALFDLFMNEEIVEGLYLMADELEQLK